MESVQNAIDQAELVAENIMGADKDYVPMPWFWSDQYDLKLQMAGFSQGYDEMVLRGDPNERSFAAFYLKDGVVIAVDAVSRAPEFMVGKKLISGRVKIDPATLADESTDIKSLA